MQKGKTKRNKQTKMKQKQTTTNKQEGSEWKQGSNFSEIFKSMI